MSSVTRRIRTAIMGGGLMRRKTRRCVRDMSRLVLRKKREQRKDKYRSGELAPCGGYELAHIAERYGFRPEQREACFLERVKRLLVAS